MKQEPELILDVFVASMACPCGGGRADADSETANAALLELRRRHPGRISLRVHALNLHLPRFRNTRAVAKLLQEKGHGALPAVVLGDTILFAGRIRDADVLEAAVAPYLSPHEGEGLSVDTAPA